MKAVSPLVGFVITIFLTIMVTTLTFTVIKPTLERSRGFNVINEASVNLELLSSAINEVATEAEGSRRTITLSISDGEYFIDKNSNSIVFTFEPSVDLGVIGRIGDKFLEKGLQFFDFFNSYLNNQIPIYLKVISGDWKVFNNRLEGVNGTSYFFIDKILDGFYIASNFGSDNNLGQIFVSPVNLSGLVLYLTFDEGSGNIVYDYSGNKNNGTYFGYNPHTQSNSTLLYLTGSSPINLTHYFYLPNKAILSDVNLTIYYRNNTPDLTYNTIRVFVNDNYIGEFRDNGESSTVNYAFVNVLKSNFTAGALNKITFEGNVTNITQTTLKYIQEIEWVNGKVGRALSFDGVDDYAKIEPFTVYGWQEITISEWVYAVHPKANTYWSKFSMIGDYWTDYPSTHLSTDNRTDYTWITATWATRKPDGTRGAYGYNWFAYRNQWVHLVRRFDRNREYSVWINGEKKYSVIIPADEKTVLEWNPDTATSPERYKRFVLGANVLFTEHMKCLSDEVLIYNRALSAEEIKFLYEEGLKKLQNSGMIQFNSKIKPFIAISNPSGKIYVENLRVGNQNSKEIKLIKPLYNLEFESNFRFSKGSRQIKIENVGFNFTSKRPIIRISE